MSAPLLGTVAVEPYIGTVLTIAAICILMPLMWGERRLGLIISFALGFTILVTLVFSTMLKVYFEPGIFNLAF